MTVEREKIEAQIEWYNGEVESVKTRLMKWLKEFGHQVTISEQKITITEELSGPYRAFRYDFLIDESLKVSLIPNGIWIVGAKGRIDLIGPSGTEKLVYFFVGGPGISTETKDGSGKVIEKSSHGYFDNVDEENWYWYDDSTYRKVVKFTKDVVEPILERLQ